MTMTMGAVAAAAITGLADAAIIFFTDEALFNQALADAGKFFKGIEDFEQTLLTPGNPSSLVNDPLNINNLQGLFNPGDFIDNLTFQANTNGTLGVIDPGVNGPNPRGLDGMQLAIPLPPGIPFLNVGLQSVFGEDSLDIISGPPTGGNHTALGMHVFIFAGQLFPLEVRVFDKNEQQVGFVTLPGVDLAGQFIGILATGGETIGRVNLFNDAGTLEGVYDVQTYLIPAPSALALLGLAGLLGVHRRRR